MIKTAGDLISEAQTQIKCLDPVAAKILYEESIQAVILDVREAHSAAESKLSMSINISRGLIEMQVPKHCPHIDTVIMTHCGGGGRASLAALSLQQMGYANVYAITATYEEIKKTFD
jgi:rhodanese-related sulfurtransferase